MKNRGAARRRLEVVAGAAGRVVALDAVTELRQQRLERLAPRCAKEISEQVVEDYAERLGEGAAFPPVVVFSDGSSCWLADGFRRLRAFRRAGRAEIEADVYAGTLDDALGFAPGANRAHGARLSRADKQYAVELAFRTWPVLSQGRVARHVGCTQQYVSKIREQLTTSCKLLDLVVGRDGTLYSARRPASARPVSEDFGSDDSSKDSVSETVVAPASDPSVPEAAAARACRRGRYARRVLSGFRTRGAFGAGLVMNVSARTGRCRVLAYRLQLAGRSACPGKTRTARCGTVFWFGALLGAVGLRAGFAADPDGKRPAAGCARRVPASSASIRAGFG